MDSPAPAGHRPSGSRADVFPDPPTGRCRGRDRGTKDPRSDGMGPAPELHPQPLGGDGHKRPDLQLTLQQYSSLPSGRLLQYSVIKHLLRHHLHNHQYRIHALFSLNRYSIVHYMDGITRTASINSIGSS